MSLCLRGEYSLVWYNNPSITMAFFTRERFGRPQLYAGLLLVLFAAQCLWIISKTPLRQSEIRQIERGVNEWRHGQIDAEAGAQSPLIALAASAAIAPFPDASLNATLLAGLARLPFLSVGMLFGASLWYVTHRLYGNAGGYVALALYCFSPAMVEAGSRVNGQGPAAWGFFGAIFSAIALSHTVYALGDSPRQQLAGLRRWRWRRIMLLGVAFGIAVGAQPLCVGALPLALAFMLYLAPGRRLACVAIVAMAGVIGLGIVLAACFFHVRLLAQLFAISMQPAPPLGPGTVLWLFFDQYAPILLLLFAITLLTYLGWRRARYFGNTAPLLVLVLLCITCGFLPFPLLFMHEILTFTFVFVGGIMADLLEGPQRRWALFGLAILLGLYSAWGVRSSLRLPSWPDFEILHPQARFRYHLTEAVYDLPVSSSLVGRPFAGTDRVRTAVPRNSSFSHLATSRRRANI